MSPVRLSVLVFLSATLTAACQQAEPPKRYPIKGQILAVGTERQELTISHDDIPGFMPGMTMTFPVASAEGMKGRVAGEIVTATLEVDNSQGRLVDIVHVGEAPLSGNTNQVAMASALLDVGAEVPDAAFIDQTDARRSFAEWKGSLTLVNFVYTSCPLPTFCPLMDQNFATIQDAVAEDPQLHGQVKLVSISIDPVNDTPAVLAAHAKKRRSDPAVWTWLTGDTVTVDRFAGRFGVGILRAADSKDITHNLRTVLIDKSGRIRAFYNGSNWTPQAVIADLRAAAR